MNEKKFSIRIPKEDYELLVSMAAADRSTVAQQIRIAIARYVDNPATINNAIKPLFNLPTTTGNMGNVFTGMAKPWDGK